MSGSVVRSHLLRLENMRLLLNHFVTAQNNGVSLIGAQPLVRTHLIKESCFIGIPIKKYKKRRYDNYHRFPMIKRLLTWSSKIRDFLMYMLLKLRNIF